MKLRLLLLLVMMSFITVLQAQKKQAISGYAITAMEKGGKSWKEVRLVDISTGEQLKSIYQSNQQLDALNARTGKPVAKKDPAKTLVELPRKRVVNLDQELDRASSTRVQSYTIEERRQPTEERRMAPTKIENGQLEKTIKAEVETRVIQNVNQNLNRNVNVVIVRGYQAATQTDKPFATNSAAMAYDKKHERLYYTPMGIAQLRYIDLKSKEPKIYYFEDEPFGVVAGLHDASNQITRMVIASDGNGYALSNDANHLIRFTIGKKPTITDLGALTDDAANGTNTVHHRNGYGGDMIADKSGNLYLITANRNVFKVSIESKVAVFKGAIKGLPRGFSTNGAMVEEGSKVIVASSESTVGYFRFDLNTLQAEKVSSDATVFNASDLANGNLAFEKKKKDKKQKQEPEVKEEEEQVDNAVAEAGREPVREEALTKGMISVYPNPVTNGMVKVSFDDQPAGKYQVQLIDVTGRLIRAQEVNIQQKAQVVEFKVPEVAKGSYLLKVLSEPNNISITNKLVIQ